MKNIVDYLSYEEIHMQHATMEKTIDYMLENSSAIKDLFADREDVVFVASGSSYWMSLSAHRSMKLMTHKRTYAIKGADVCMCPEEYSHLYDKPIFVVPSRSGRTRDVNAALLSLKKMYPGSRVVAIIEYPENQLKDLSDLALYIEWANERSVCQTRSFSNLYVASLTMAAILGNDMSMIARMRDFIVTAAQLSKEHEAKTRSLANVDNVKCLVTLASGLQYGVSIEGAYIVTEIAEFPTNYYQLLEYRHGPIVAGGKDTAVFICSGGKSCAEFEAKMAEEIRQNGSKVYAVACSEVDWADYTYCLGKEFDKEMVALYFVNILQSFSFYFSIARGKNPDSPGNLVPFITY